MILEIRLGKSSHHVGKPLCIELALTLHHLPRPQEPEPFEGERWGLVGKTGLENCFVCPKEARANKVEVTEGQDVEGLLRVAIAEVQPLFQMFYKFVQK